MANIDETKGKRTRLTNELGNCYFFVSDADIMMTVADENSRQAARDRAMLETICRISSKALKDRLTLTDIIEQMRKGDSGRCTLLSEMARYVEEYGMLAVDEDVVLTDKERAYIETICLISFNGMRKALTLEDIVELMKSGDSGRCTLLSEMARCIEEYKPKGGE